VRRPRIRRNDLVPMLLHVVEDGKTELRENAVRLLGIIGGDAARDAAITALADYSFWVRGAAAEALGRIADPSTVMHLAKALTDPELYVHERAWDALTKIGGQEAEEVLTAWENQKSVSARSTKRKQRSPTRMDFEITEDYE
jgi:HEAT repeat protein